MAWKTLQSTNTAAKFQQSFFYSMSKKDTNKDSMKKKGNRGRGKRRGAGNTDSGGCTVYNIVQIL